MALCKAPGGGGGGGGGGGIPLMVVLSNVLSVVL